MKIFDKIFFYGVFYYYLGIENLQGFCKQNQKFSTSLNPSEISVNRESVRLYLFLIKFKFLFLIQGSSSSMSL